MTVCIDITLSVAVGVDRVESEAMGLKAAAPAVAVASSQPFGLLHPQSVS